MKSKLGTKLPIKGIKRKAGIGLQRVKRPLQKSKPIKGRKIPKGTDAWIKAIPVSKKAHGSGHLQKRLWRLKSDFVRIRDWTAFGKFIDTNERIVNWNDAQAGHYRSYNECNGMFKFHEMNIHAQSPSGNAWPTSTTWENYKRNLTNRYTPEFVEAIDVTNQGWPLKINNLKVITEIKRTLKMLGMMKVQPDYYKRVMSLLQND